jgi:hypothetical protein
MYGDQPVNEPVRSSTKVTLPGPGAPWCREVGTAAQLSESCFGRKRASPW